MERMETHVHIYVRDADEVVHVHVHKQEVDCGDPTLAADIHRRARAIDAVGANPPTIPATEERENAT